jgi:hypothetical protein
MNGSVNYVCPDVLAFAWDSCRRLSRSSIKSFPHACTSGCRRRGMLLSKNGCKVEMPWLRSYSSARCPISSLSTCSSPDVNAYPERPFRIDLGLENYRTNDRIVNTSEHGN